MPHTHPQITVCEPDAGLQLLNGDCDDAEQQLEGLVQSDFLLVGDVKWVVPLNSIQDSFNIHQLQPPMISANGIVLSRVDQLHDTSLDRDGMVAISTMDPTQYTSYYPCNSDARKLLIKAFFCLNSKCYKHGAPVLWPGKIIHVNGYLHDLVRNDSGRTTCIILVEDIDSLASGALPNSARSAATHGPAGWKHKFVFDPTTTGETTSPFPAQTSPSENTASTARSSVAPADAPPAADSAPPAKCSHTARGAK
ncbi:hypothetical protein K466DRAFT_569128 [Polyporus arcularius HHB13444]|uniref:Uncharacterized protein n=1 Tax=Polyporus arcularius HHB13444 TaxID=1314778 RepID=A0A5C3NW44_9APHY|nr:hypothetical protein K466DRAFT_569128 [Polyporus arcularius HHB13444]